jgi:hypothetical protein
MGTFRRRAILLALLSFVVIVFGTLPTHADTVISIQPSLPVHSVGSLFDVFVDISSVTDLYAFQFDISFDPAILSAASVTEGSFLNGGGLTFFISGTINNIAGSITSIADTFLSPLPGVSGSGTLADLKFQALAVGTSSIGLSNVTLLNSTLSEIVFNLNNGSASVTSSVPEPTTMLLLGFGLVGLVELRRKFIK